MASLRKRYQSRAEDKDGPPVTTMPQGTAAQLPPAAVDAPKPPEQIEPESSPAEQAAQTAIKQRLAEVERAEAITRAGQPRVATEPQQIDPIYAAEPQEQPPTTEQIIASSGLPERAKAWLRSHSEYVSDPQKNAHIQGLHYAAAHQAGGDAFSDLYFEKMESLLGLRQAPQSNGNGTYQSAPPTVQRQAAPVRQYAGPPVSAPPTRDAPSMTTGRPTSSPMQLTAEERELAHMLKQSPEEYAANKKKMLAMKAAGVIQDGR